MCEICNDTGRVDVLDLWTIQREHIKYGDVDFDSAEALPLLRQAIRCPECQGEDASESDMEDLTKRMGGDPWDADTFT